MSGESTGPPGSIVVAAKGKRKKNDGRGWAQRGGATSTKPRYLPVESLNLEEVYHSIVAPSSVGRQKLAFATAFNPPPSARGILNNSNYCFMNATAQALVFLPPFAQLAISAVLEAELCPTLATLGKWMLSYWARAPNQLVPPLSLPKAVRGQTASSAAPSHWGKMDGSSQEDATEFMHHLLEVIQTELCALEGSYGESSNGRIRDPNTSLEGNSEKKGWTFVKGRERLSVREHCDKSRSVLLDAVFGGAVENHLKGKSKLKDHASVLVEGFFLLQVDVGFSAECSLEMALERSLQRERVYDSARAKDLLKTVKLRRLPTVLLLQLQRWAVTAEGELVKLDNLVRFSKTLVLPKSTCSDNTLSNAARTYELVAFIAHRGKATERGHYVAYLTNASLSTLTTAQGEAALTFCNDAKVHTVTMREAIEGEAVYLLVYQRKK
ncbi:ubiquitin hydrolase CA [Trypanosoma cruzi cruzi]|uniref:ubiquitinyl hydrolase 1 n=1 Tax=Trypanosoma cruzi TaxID=5693 RepID=A0A2V2VKM9_TRYCR|nr:putative ubiquitin hydrolase [Trypanosoma cruzi]PBJ70467.1 ubiquitin hydrolase CA [Trypanosoma cruzi cruzi]PWU96995.1 putative ubiquitin hydrolase [Trypanosoma cruzi]